MVAVDDHITLDTPGEEEEGYNPTHHTPQGAPPPSTCHTHHEEPWPASRTKAVEPTARANRRRTMGRSTSGLPTRPLMPSPTRPRRGPHRRTHIHTTRITQQPTNFKLGPTKMNTTAIQKTNRAGWSHPANNQPEHERKPSHAMDQPPISEEINHLSQLCSGPGARRAHLHLSGQRQHLAQCDLQGVQV